MWNKKKKDKKEIFYQAWLTKRNKRMEINKIAKSMEVEPEKIIVKKVSFMGKVLEILMDLIYRIGRVAFILTICILLTLGANAIINPQMREILFNYLPF